MAVKHDILSVLQEVRDGTLSPEDALLRLKLAPFEDLGYAKVDYHRAVRQGVPEVIYGQSKTTEQIRGILESMRRRGCVNILVTRIGPDVAEALKRYPVTCMEDGMQRMEDGEEIYVVKSPALGVWKARRD